MAQAWKHLNNDDFDVRHYVHSSARIHCCLKMSVIFQPPCATEACDRAISLTIPITPELGLPHALSPVMQLARVAQQAEGGRCSDSHVASF
jgi:hypothetical protein